MLLNGNENGDNKLREIWDYYPELFKEEKELSEKMKEQDELEKAKAGRRRLAYAMNRKYKGDD